MRKIHFNIKTLTACGAIAILAMGCDKEDGGSKRDNNRIAQVLADNFNLTVMNTVITRGGVRPLTDGPKTVTVFAPSDEAFAKAGYANNTAILTAAYDRVVRLANYHTVEGNYEIEKMPFLFNQEINSLGGKLYVTRWIKNGDTVLTINGSRLLSTAVNASNGKVQVIDRMLEPYVHATLTDAIASNASLTLFNQALQRAGMIGLLSGKVPHTVYAPNNSAMAAIGYGTLETIEAADPAVLADMIRYQVVEDRRFVNDYILSTGPTNEGKQGMLNNNSVTVTLIADPQRPGSFSGIRLKGIGNTSETNLVHQDIITGNGVLHITDQVLRITQ
ncbi:fasciclin domain-containing protein [Chitinophaga horti]|uniref:Fasciclin domain-containing protein n=1 Tax=Chitinophaga horti TaxID=2920382 RepID=A0ABY6J8I9_9BACT|nr:fasciclin domain-containing protein [Chitinophaga horti]UYQ95641.1 fasciclin domain-containing protein [Chitinophaga horti]